MDIWTWIYGILILYIESNLKNLLPESNKILIFRNVQKEEVVPVGTDSLQGLFKNTLDEMKVDKIIFNIQLAIKTNKIKLLDDTEEISRLERKYLRHTNA